MYGFQSMLFLCLPLPTPSLRCVILDFLFKSKENRIGLLGRYGALVSFPFLPVPFSYSTCSRRRIKKSEWHLSHQHLLLLGSISRHLYGSLLPMSLLLILTWLICLQIAGNASMSFDYYTNVSDSDLIGPNSVALFNGTHQFSFAFGCGFRYISILSPFWLSFLSTALVPMMRWRSLVHFFGNAWPFHLIIVLIYILFLTRA